MMYRDIDKQLNKYAEYCSKQERCSNDVFYKLKKEGVSQAITEKIIANLKKENFLNDERYAKSFAYSKFIYNKWGKIKISHSLKQKGITESIINEALKEIDDKEYHQLLQKILKKKYESIRRKDANFYQIKAKLHNYAISKGFEYDLINKAIDAILE